MSAGAGRRRAQAQAMRRCARGARSLLSAGRRSRRSARENGTFEAAAGRRTRARRSRGPSNSPCAIAGAGCARSAGRSTVHCRMPASGRAATRLLRQGGEPEPQPAARSPRCGRVRRRVPGACPRRGGAARLASASRPAVRQRRARGAPACHQSGSSPLSRSNASVRAARCHSDPDEPQNFQSSRAEHL